MKPWSWPWGTIPIREKELKELEEKAEKLETVREFVLSRRVDIVKNIENFGVLKPVFNYFLEKDAGRRKVNG